jgi:hypothetical protein
VPARQSRISLGRENLSAPRAAGGRVCRRQRPCTAAGCSRATPPNRSALDSLAGRRDAEEASVIQDSRGSASRLYRTAIRLQLGNLLPLAARAGGLALDIQLLRLCGAWQVFDLTAARFVWLLYFRPRAAGAGDFEDAAPGEHRPGRRPSHSRRPRYPPPGNFPMRSAVWNCRNHYSSRSQPRHPLRSF